MGSIRFWQIGQRAKWLPCGWDNELQAMVHRFDLGMIICRCGKRVVRAPVKDKRLIFGNTNKFSYEK